MLENLEPKSVFNYFEKICSIPHGSGNVQQISDYLIKFAEEHSLDANQDELYNVIIKKSASKGMENYAPVILQGHMDMVAVKNPGCSKNMQTDGLDIRLDKDWIYAKDTSLGGDDGIAVAYALAILASDDIKHPALEVVITTDEETGMEGALGIDLSALKGTCMINIDSEKEGEFTVGCAGGVRVNAKLPIQWQNYADADLTPDDNIAIEITLTGLSSGHSGLDIHKNQGNANKLMGEILKRLKCEFKFNLFEINGGEKDNVIPCECKASIVMNLNDEMQMQDLLSGIEADFRARLKKTDKRLSIQYKRVKLPSKVLEVSSMDDVIEYLDIIPNGVQKTEEGLSDHSVNMVRTSLNLGVIDLKENEFIAVSSIRSSLKEEKEELQKNVIDIIKKFHASYELTGDYPAWEYKEDSKLREICVSVYERMYQTKPEILSVHAGLECGIIAQKISGLDSISIGPTMENIHTTKERISISSIRRVWEFILELLKEGCEQRYE